jgi:TonB family protein
VSSAEHFVWAVDGKPVSVHLSAHAVRQLEAIRPQPGETRTPEAGGLLLGRFRQVNDGWIVAVDAIELSSCEHARGASWTLSRRDRSALARQIRRFSKAGVVGWFRTHTRPGLYLDEHDHQLFRDLFTHPAAVALAMREDAQAGFFFWENGEIVRTRPYTTFKCTAEALRFTPAPVKQPVAPASVSPVRSWHKGLAWLPLAAAVGISVLWVGPNPFGTKTEPAPSAESAKRPVFAPPPLDDSAKLVPAVAERTEPVVRKPSAMAPVEQPPARLAARPAAPRRVEPVVVARLEPPKPNVVKRAVAAIPGFGFLTKKKKAADDSPAVAVRQVPPARFTEPFPVRVKVKIGSDGYVKSTHLLTSSASAETAQAVMRAARAWRFTPARQENRPVASELILTFEPHPSRAGM